ncbi:unnamed protein product [Cuscuta europaea]|uniref:RNase H type-1 domain-containing protein n=1 Tax=Cuscuta europaea TaxID=41803 RepID=A0A9P0ZWR5_CUSEU|nr:unnamed protein product [Cuscuta europaea]CAH9117859.1 unnamed protein product [Cuscuta europaea]
MLLLLMEKALMMLYSAIETEIYLCAFVPLAVGSVLQAEAWTVLEALKWCQRMRYERVQIETDSEVLCKALKKSTSASYLEEISRFIAILQATVVHCYREINTVAHLLSREALQSGTHTVFSSPSELSRLVFTQLFLDVVLTPAIRF